MVLLRNEAACAALLDGRHPTIWGRISATSDLADLCGAAETFDDAARWFHAAHISGNPHSMSSKNTDFSDSGFVLTIRKYCYAK
jgi:hypothetical protein